MDCVSPWKAWTRLTDRPSSISNRNMTGFASRGEIREPDWARSIMQNYW
jgi:hypothetical protein